MTDEPVLVLRVGQQMVDIMYVFDGLMEYVYWDEDEKCWQEDIGDISYQIATGLNRLKYRPLDPGGYTRADD